MDTVIRPASDDDAAAIAAVQVASWRTTYHGLIPDETLVALSVAGRTERWREILARDGHAAFVAEERGEGDPTVVGFVDGGPNRSSTSPFDAFSGELYAIYLLASHQRGGTGTRLTAALVRQLLKDGHGSMLVWVLESNPSRAFYEALGGRLVGAQEIEIDGAAYPDVAYGWDDLAALGRRLAR